MLGAVTRDEGTHLQVPDSDFPLPELCPQGMEFRKHAPWWPLLWFQSLYDLGVGKDTAKVTLLASRVVGPTGVLSVTTHGCGVSRYDRHGGGGRDVQTVGDVTQREAAGWRPPNILTVRALST